MRKVTFDSLPIAVFVFSDSQIVALIVGSPEVNTLILGPSCDVLSVMAAKQ